MGGVDTVCTVWVRAAGEERTSDGTATGTIQAFEFDRALTALEAGDALVITALDRLARSTQNTRSV